MGATVTGIDAVDKNIKIAHIHAVCITHLHVNCHVEIAVLIFLGLILCIISTRKKYC